MLSCTYSHTYFPARPLLGHVPSRSSFTGHLDGRRTQSLRASPCAVTVHFTEEDIIIEAQPKENIVEVPTLRRSIMAMYSITPDVPESPKLRPSRSLLWDIVIEVQAKDIICEAPTLSEPRMRVSCVDV